MNASEISLANSICTVQEFTGSELPPTNPSLFRWSVCRWKKTKDNPNPRKAVAVIVPRIKIESVNPQILSDSIGNLIDDLQDEMVRGMIEDGKTEWNFSDCSADALAAFAAAKSMGERFTAETIKTWFDSHLAESVMSALAQKGITDANIIADRTNQYRNAFASLAAPVPSVSRSVLTSLSVVVTKANEGDVTTKLASRIAALLKKDEISLDAL